jgi:DNA-binding MarR family transcriptional regulator
MKRVTKKVDLSECHACACFAVRRAARTITQHYDRHLRAAGLRATQFTVLVVLKTGGPQPLHRVAEYLGMERTTLTRNLRPLVARGWVSGDAGSDKRVRMIAITDAGIAAAAKGLPHWRRAQRSVAKRLAPAGLAALGKVARMTP